jgi:sulfide:quinone oxidoreductase
VVSNYTYETVPMTWQTMQRLQPGDTALFTQPSTPIKCGGAPQKIMYLTADHLRKRGILDEVDIEFFSPGTVVFGVTEFERTLKKVIDRYGINFHIQEELVELRPDAHEAVFQVIGGDGAPGKKVVEYDMIHVTPPQSAPDFIKRSALANTDGWVDVDKHTLQHNRYDNIFSLGDAAGTPNAKTGAAVRKQAPVVVHNLLQMMREGVITTPKTYHGYSSCPLVTGYGKLVLAEFDYDNNPDPSFPFDTTQERYSMYALKAYGLPEMYWHGMLRGRA